jgi:hypothetical protein
MIVNLRDFFMAKTIVILCLIFIFMAPASSFAYLDPGSGSMLLQIILGGVAGLVVVCKLYWGRFLSLLGIRKKPNDATNESES